MKNQEYIIASLVTVIVAQFILVYLMLYYSFEIINVMNRIKL